jgi:tetratricopeptide (TPR) repeat protein
LQRALITIALCAAVVLTSGRAGAAAQDELTEFQLAMNAYDTGEYGVAAKRLRALLDRDPPLGNKALVFEVHKYLGAALMFLGRQDEAQEQFEALLREDPEYELDPVLFPTEILDAFYEVKLRLAGELEAIQKAKMEAELKAKAEQEARKKELKQKLLDAAKPVYLASTKRHRNLVVAFVPFGVGQFQNGQNLKGALFMAGEGGLLAANVTFWALTEYYAARSGRGTAYENTATNYKLATNVLGGVLIGAMVAGIIDAIVYFARIGKEKAEFRAIDEDEVPPDLRKQPPEILDEDLDSVLGLSFVWP